MKDNSYRRHIAKTISWRIVGTIDTILLAWFISGDASTGLKIGIAEVITKMILYYGHERLWFRSEFNPALSGNSKKRHLAKTLSWRIIGTLDTIILAWLISGSPVTGLKIGFAEVVTKMLLYYLHERTWYRFNYGLENRKKNNSNILSEKEPSGDL